MRILSYAAAINEAFHQVMEQDERVFILGQGVNNPWYVGTTAEGLWPRFGPRRVIDPPISESAMNGLAIGAALAGRRPILIHPRLDFLLVGLDQLINEASNWAYVFGGQISVPLVVRGIINRGGEQGAQHSQALQAMFMHAPGLKVVMPFTPHDAKGLLMAAVRDPNPVVYIDDRWLYDEVGPVPEEPYMTPIGKAAVMTKGSDVTVVASSFMVKEALEAASELALTGVSTEVIDLRSLKPLDGELICQSVARTGHLVVADSAWKTAGPAAEVVALVAERVLPCLKGHVARVCLPDVPAPSSPALERLYYPRARDVVEAVRSTLGYSRSGSG